MLIDRVLPAKAGPAFYARLALNLLSPLPYSVQVHNSRALCDAIRRVADERPIDLWQCEWTPYGESLARVAPGPWVVMAHNIESVIWRRYGQNEPGLLKRGYVREQCRKYERFERRIFAKANCTIAVSPDDAQIAAEEFGARRVAVVDNGVDVASFQPDAAAREPYRILFLGSLDWRPNLDAVDLLLRDIFPQVRSREHRARLVIAGRKPPAALVRRAAECDGVELAADVPDVRPYLRDCGVLVVPLRIGGGSRLKILEALAAECPVVSTTIGAEGLCLTRGADFTEANTAVELAAALVDVMRRPEHHREDRPAGTPGRRRTARLADAGPAVGNHLAGRGTPERNMKGELRVVHVTASRFFGGPERQMLGLAQSLPPEIVTAFVSFAEGGRCGEFLDKVGAAGFPGIPLTHDTPRLLAALRELVLLLGRMETHILCCHGYKSNLLGLRAARRLGIPIISVSRGWTGESLRVRLYEALDRTALRWMDAVVGVSAAQGERVRQCGVRGERVAIIHNAIRADRFARPVEGRPRRAASHVSAAAGIDRGRRRTPQPRKGLSSPRGRRR